LDQSGAILHQFSEQLHKVRFDGRRYVTELPVSIRTAVEVGSRRVERIELSYGGGSHPTYRQTFVFEYDERIAEITPPPTTRPQ
jgi:hypothetical protein